MDEERVEYAYTGDVTSLQVATKQAISLLDKYERAVKRLAQSDQISLGNSIFSGFQRTVSGVLKQFSSISDYMNQSSAKNQRSWLPDASLTGRAVQEFTQVGSSAKIQTDAYSTITEISTMKSRMVEMVNDMLNSVKQLTGAFDPVTAKLMSYRTRATSAMGAVHKVLASVSAAFRRVSQDTDGSEHEAIQATQAHEGLTASVQALQRVLQTEQHAIRQEEDALKSKNQALKTSSRSHSSLSAVLTRLSNSFRYETNHLGLFSDSLHRTAAGANALKNVLSRLTLVQIGRWLAQAIKYSIDYVENLNLFTVAMGDAVDEGMKFVNTMSEIYGMDPSNLYRYTGYFYQLTDAIGMTSGASSVLSLSLTKAANDIASLFNVNIESVVDDLASGMQGMSRSVRKYGMDIRATTLEQTALKYGLTAQVETMSEANRMALRYLTMMEQVKNATSQTVEEIDGSTKVIGDFARTIETPANQLRIFKEQFVQLGRAIGNFFVPALQIVMPVLNGIVMALRTMLTFIAVLTGFTEELIDSTQGIQDSSGAIDDLGDSASATTRKLQKMLAPFDELNVLTDKQAAGSSDILDPALQEAIENMELSLDNVKMRANEIRDSILSFFGFEWTEVFNPDTGEWETKLQWFADSFRENLIEKFPQWSNTINALFDNWASIMTALQEVWQALLFVIRAVLARLDDLLRFFGVDSRLASGIAGVATAFAEIARWVQRNSTLVADLILVVLALVSAFQGFTAIAPLIATVGQLVSATGAAISGFGTAIAIIAGAAAAIALLYTNSERFASSFRNLLSSVWSGLVTMGSAVLNLVSTIWESLRRLWSEHVQPMLRQTGDALAPVLDTVSTLWRVFSTIIANIANTLARVWNSTIEPVLGAFVDAIGGLMEIFQALWETVIGPVLDSIANGLQTLWVTVISPVVEDIIEIIGGLMEAILNLWNAVLQPLVNYLVSVFGPVFREVFTSIWDIVQLAVSIILGALQLLTGALVGLIEFLNGVFTGDWRRALSGLANVAVALGNSIITVIEAVCNFGITTLNTFLSNLVEGIKRVVNNLGDLIKDLAKLAGISLNLDVNWTAPSFSSITIPRIPQVALEHGGVVTRPTQALIGEGKYDEAVIPLGDSPQMKNLVNQIADAERNRDREDVVPVQLFLDGDIFYEAMAKRARAARLRSGMSAF